MARAPPKHMNIHSIKWSDPTYLPTTKRGPMTLRTAPLPDSFWPEYEADPPAVKRAMAAAGITMKQLGPGRWELQEWRQDTAAQERKDSKYEESFQAAASTNWPIASPYQARPYQLAGATYIAKNPRTLLADDMGLGKTLQTIIYANGTPEVKLILVVAPPNLRNNWRREFKKFGTRDGEIMTIKGTPKKGEEAGLALRLSVRRKIEDQWTVIVTGYTDLVKWSKIVHGIQWDMVIIDESHFIKNPKAARHKAVVGEWCKKRHRNVGGIEGRVRVALTGTPIENGRPVELVPILSWLGVIGKFGGPWKFINRYCGGGSNGFGVQKDGLSNAKELNRRLREECMIRRLKSQVLTEIPPKRRQIIAIEAADKVLKDEERALAGTLLGKEYKRLQAMDAVADPEAYRKQVATLQNAFKGDFKTISKIRQSNGLAKIKDSLEITKAALAECSDQILVACYHREVIAQIADGLTKAGEKPIVYQGGMTSDQKTQAEDDFQAGKARVIIVQIVAGGVGITLTAAKLVLVIEQMWTPGAMEQLEDRSCRFGQDRSILVQYLVIEGGLDAHMAQILANKAEGITQILDEKLTADLKPAEPEKPTPVAKPIEVITRPAAKASEPKPKPEPTTPEPQNLPLAARYQIRQCLRHLAAENHFSRYDTRYGSFLANLKPETMAPKFARDGRRLCNRYRNQLEGLWI